MGIIQDHMTKTDRVYKYLENEILNGNLRPGTRLIIKNICETLGASDSPVREALKLLEANGMIEKVPYVGAVVMTPSADWIEEMFVMRSAIEGMAAYLAVPNIDDEQLKKIIDVKNEMYKCLQNKDSAQYGLWDRSFHRLIYEKTPHAILLKELETLSNKAEYGRAIFGLDPYRMVESNLEHDELIEALKERDAYKAQKIVQEHRLRVGRQLKALILRGSGDQV